MKKNQTILIFMFIALTVLVSLYFDSEISEGVSLIRTNFLNEFFLGITFISSKIIIFFFLTILFLWREYKRKWVLPLWFTLALSSVVSFLIKFAVQRQRPFQLGIASVLPVLEKANHFVWNFSFPSSHAMLGFCAIPILSKEFPRFKYVWIVFAGLIGFSRIYFGLHFLSDVIVGGLIGYLIGWFIVRKETETKSGERIYRKMFR